MSYLGCCRSACDDNDHHALRSAVRQGMWRHVMHEAGRTFTDLSNISKDLAKDLQRLKY